MKSILSTLLILLSISSISQPTAWKGRRAATSSISITPGTPSTIGQFIFSLPDSATTSAGVFTADTVLVRTLWSGVKYGPGDHVAAWDGKDDTGAAVSPVFNYHIEVVRNNMTVEWGVIGNSSPVDGPTKWGQFDQFKDMVIVGNYAYVAGGYDETIYNRWKFALDKPQEKHGIYYWNAMQYSNAVTGDDSIMYWSHSVPNESNKTYIFATRTRNDEPVIFENGQPHEGVHDLHVESAFDIYTDSRYVSGMAVQKKSNFLFVSHRSFNEVIVYNKLTAAPIRTNTITDAHKMCVDANDNLWIISGNTVTKYAVNGSGTFTPVLSLSGLVEPVAIAVTLDNANVAVVDAGTSQQIKWFSNSTGQAGVVFGQLGGYATSAKAYTDKFMFNGGYNYIAFQADGSYWVSDYGNYRNLHFTANNQYIDQISYAAHIYSAWTDPNNPSRVCNLFLEYNRDYSKTINEPGAWVLVNNWKAALSNLYEEDAQLYNAMKNFTTLSNGRTYCIIWKQFQFEVMEAIDGGVLRGTGIILPRDYELNKNGNLYRLTAAGGYNQNLDNVYYERQLTGFDSNNNPVWANDVEIDRITNIGNYDPVFRGDFGSAQEITSNGTRVTFEAANRFENYHLGGWRNGKWRFKTSKSTHPLYEGWFPTDGYTDIGNGGNYSLGGPARALDSFIFVNYHGEFWKQSQINIHNVYLQNGLFLMQTGTDRGGRKPGYPMMAGNGFAVTVVKVNNDFIIHHNTESYNAGAHEFRIKGANTVRKQCIEISYPAGYVPPVLPYLDVTAGLAYNTSLENGKFGWTRSPETDILGPRLSQHWQVRTSKHQWDRNKPVDVQAEFRFQQGNPSYVDRTLNNNANLNTWSVSGEILMKTISIFSNGDYGKFQILDNNNYVISNLEVGTPSFGYSGFFVKANDVNMYAVYDTPETGYVNQGPLAAITSQLQKIKITGSAAGIKFEYANFPTITVPKLDFNANWRKPAKIRLAFDGGNGVQSEDQIIDLKDFQFRKN